MKTWPLVVMATLSLALSLPARSQGEALQELAAPTPAAIHAAAVMEMRLRKLSEAELMAAYENPETVMDGEDVSENGTQTPFGIESRRFWMFQKVRVEIARRGARMQPLLLAFLRREVARDRFAPSSAFSGIGTRYVADAFQLLAGMRGERALETAMAVVELLDSPIAVEGARQEALAALEQLTFCGYFQCQPHSARDTKMVERENAAATPHPLTRADAALAAQWYRVWLRDEGADASRWLDVARGRARRLLADDDLEDVYCATQFLSSPADDGRRGVYLFGWKRRDDAPDQTAARLGEILAQAQRTPEDANNKSSAFHEYSWGGRPLPVSVVNWAQLLATYGSHARPFAPALMRLQEQEGIDGLHFFNALSNIGGPEVVAYFVTWLPRLENQLQKLGIAGNRYRYAALKLKELPPGQPQQTALFADRTCRYTIDRWAGRVFTGNTERLAWWQTARDQKPQDWLRAHMRDTAAKADAGDEIAQSIVRAALPDLPQDEAEVFWRPAMEVLSLSRTPAPAPKPFRVQWLNQHWEQLRYDAASHTFLLTSQTEKTS